jgi:putative component of membrane protein insertase Oxa1/YidC/SpoIIIJ protein YidD
VSWALVLAIRFYWAVWPARWRRNCVYRESCSRYVYRAALEGGLAGGLRALRERHRTCRPGYGILRHHGAAWLVLADGSVLSASEASATALPPVSPP